jgi:murein DD-endopeptidase MepM/ murein hydrolase activator NlpD
MTGRETTGRAVRRRLRGLWVLGSVVALLLSGSATSPAWAETASRVTVKRTGPQGKGAAGPVSVRHLYDGSGEEASEGTGGQSGSRRVWPLAGSAGRVRAKPRVTRGWEPPPSPWAAGHRGVDLAASRSQKVRAVADGRVSFSGKVAGRGVLSIELSGTGRPPVRTTYEPVRPTVEKGRRVRAGEVVATVAGGTAHCRGACLHWGAKRAEQYIDPLSLLPARLLRGGPSRLLPLFRTPAAAARRDRARPPGPLVAAGDEGATGTAGRGEPVRAASRAGAGGLLLALVLAAAVLLVRRPLRRRFSPARQELRR